MQGIFISYRRQDSQSAAGRLADDIKENIVDVPVFRDVETIAPGWILSKRSIARCSRAACCWR